MAAFFSTQLDFILFFYGLAFILLGATCFAIFATPAAARAAAAKITQPGWWAWGGGLYQPAPERL